MDCYVYDANGVIVATKQCPEAMLASQTDGVEAWSARAGLANPATQYVDVASPGAPLATKPPIGYTINKTTLTADGVDLVTLSGLPVPTQCTLSGPLRQSWSETDGQVDISVGLPGTYTLRLEAVNKLPVELTLVAS